MFRVRTLWCLLLALLVGVFFWWQSGTPSLPDNGKERTTAELLVGTWRIVSIDGRPRDRQQSLLTEYRADGTYRTSNNDRLRVIWLTQREGQYVFTGNVIRHHYEMTTEDEEHNSRNFTNPHFPGRWDDEIVVASRDELIVLSPSGDSRIRVLYRRVR